MSIRSLRRRLLQQVLLCGIVGFLLPLTRALLLRFPEPRGHDTFSYLLATDTFAHGQLTNPSPALPMFFDAPHILVEPTYQSKYPPGGPLFMAFGQVVCGHPLWGIWLTSGLFGAAVCWMLQTFGLHRWAVPMTIFFNSVLVTYSGIGFVYLPGLFTGASAATFLGGMNQTLRRPSLGATTLLSLGVIGLASTRPFEGGLICLGCLPGFLTWLIRDQRVNLSFKLRNALLPGMALVGTYAVCLGAYNQAVTGYWLKMPYSLHHQQYFHAGLFGFQEIRTPSRTVCPRIETTYRLFGSGPAPDALQFWRTRPRIGVERCCNSFSVALGIPEESSAFWWISPFVVWGLADRRLRRYRLAIGLWFFGQSLTTWHHSWYAMPAVPLLYVSLTAVLQAATTRWRWRAPGWLSELPMLRILLVASVFLISTAYFRPTLIRELIQRLRGRAPVAQWVVSTKDHTSVSLTSREGLLQYLSMQEKPHLVFVDYSTDYNRHDEWVYNRADIANSEIILAHDLGAEQNRELLALFPDRTVWKLHIDSSGKTLKPWIP